MEMRHGIVGSLGLGVAALSFLACGSEVPLDVPAEALVEREQRLVGAACNPAIQQPSACGHGEYCSTLTSTCADVPAATCQNFSQFPPQWTKTYGTSGVFGPVIYKAAKSFFGPDPFCGGSQLVVFSLAAYSHHINGLPATRFEVPLFFYLGSGARIDASGSGLISNYVVTDQGRHATFDVKVCVASGATSLMAGFQIRDGNGLCAAAFK
jgi:hypothetical protein